MLIKNKFLIQFLIFIFFANISFAQQDKMNELLDKLDKIQKDIQTLEKAVYTKNPNLPSDNISLNEALTRQLTKISELEKQIQQMTQRYEENSYQLQQLYNSLKDKSVNTESIKLKEKPNKAQAKILPKASVAERYKFAMNIMKSGDFEKAEIAFKEFVDAHAKHELAGSAQFWYGETFYIRQLYEDAAVAFLDGYQKYPNSPKAPENLLKLGVTLAELGETEQGCKMIANLKKAYPKTDASILQKSSYEKKRFNCA
ncbi:MAG: tol-pal system protein YbgF [Proteobacteria bacterium]|nr:tol-pal system protein YbgF [Pseudomonadota bacterium]